MARKRRGEARHGWLAVDKPAGITSTHVVSMVRRLFNAQKAGHGGTLDPLATGVLPVALGEATKTVPYVMEGYKTYTFAIVFGEQRSTDDEEGDIIAVSDVRPDTGDISAVLPRFLGQIEQTPPVYSAVRIEGRRAYDLARDGQSFDIASRMIQIKSFRLLGHPSADRAYFEVRSGKGAYMRSLARDLALALGTVGYIAELRRCSCGPFHQDHAISLEKLCAFGHNPTLVELLLPVVTGLDDIPALAVTEEEACRLSNGLALPVRGEEVRSTSSSVIDGGLARAMCGDRLVAMVRTERGLFCPVRVFNL